MSTEEQRALLFSDDEIHKHFGHESDGAIALRDFYEAKITSGELMVVKTARRSEFVEASARNLRHEFCPGPGDGWVPKRAMEVEAIAFCPGCGAKIVEP